MQIIHGGDIYSAKNKYKKEIMDFSSNTNPLGIPNGVKIAIIEAIDDCEHYPDPLCRELVSSIANSESVEKDCIICGNGAADIIFRLTYAIKPKNALILSPTFAEYEQALNVVDCKVSYFELDDNDDFNVTENILNSINNSIDMMFLCNPNNPTGQLIDEKLMIKILNKCKENEVILVVDECFNEFLDEPNKHTLKPYLKEYENLFILKAFTKTYAMAGLRLGYGLCTNLQLLEKIYFSAQPWSVSTLAQKAGLQALCETKYLEDAKKLISKERDFLINSLKELDIYVMGSKANYIFFKVDEVGNLKELLEPEGILIRSCGNYKNLTNEYYRIAVKNQDENRVLVDKLREVLKK